MRFRSVSTAAATGLPRGECSATCLETCACSSGSPAASNSNRSLGCAARSTRHCGSRIQQADGAVLRLSAAEPAMDSVVKVAARHPVVDFLAEPADLEEIFLDLYRQGDHGG
jgi:hypothetical protein